MNPPFSQKKTESTHKANETLNKLSKRQKVFFFPSRQIKSAYKARDFKKKIFFPFSSFTESAYKAEFKNTFFCLKDYIFFTAYNALNIFT